MSTEIPIDLLNTDVDVASGQHMTEETVFSVPNDIAESFAEDVIPGGLADEKSPSDFDVSALRKGVKVEMEHTSDRNIAKEIAMDHLTEDPKYYDKLELVEASIRRNAMGLLDIPSSTEGGEVLDFQGIPQNPGLSREMGDDEETNYFGATEDGVDIPPENRKHQEPAGEKNYMGELDKMFDELKKLEAFLKSSGKESKVSALIKMAVGDTFLGERTQPQPKSNSRNYSNQFSVDLGNAMALPTGRIATVVPQMVYWFHNKFSNGTTREELFQAVSYTYGDTLLPDDGVGVILSERGQPLREAPKRMHQIVTAFEKEYPEKFKANSLDSELTSETSPNEYISDQTNSNYSSIQDLIDAGLVTARQIQALKESVGPNESLTSEYIRDALEVAPDTASWIEFLLMKDSQSSPVASSSRVYRFPNEKEAVKKLQYNIGAESDGLWGKDTDAAWKKFLNSKNLQFKDPGKFATAAEANEYISEHIIEGPKDVSRDPTLEELAAQPSISNPSISNEVGGEGKQTLLLNGDKQTRLIKYYTDTFGPEDGKPKYDELIADLKAGNVTVQESAEQPDGRRIALVDLGHDLSNTLRYDGFHFDTDKNVWVSGGLSRKEIRTLNLERGSIQRRELRRERHQDKRDTRQDNREDRRIQRIDRRGSAKREVRLRAIEDLYKISKQD